MEEDFKIIKALELDLANPETRCDSARLSELLADDFEEFGRSGKVHKKANILRLLPLETGKDVELSDFRFTALCKNVVLVKYRSSSGGDEANRSSIWIKEHEHWRMLHHQGTTVGSAT